MFSPRVRVWHWRWRMPEIHHQVLHTSHYPGPASSSARIVIHNQIRPLASPRIPEPDPGQAVIRNSSSSLTGPVFPLALTPHISPLATHSFFICETLCWMTRSWSKVYSCSHDTMQSRQCCYCYWTLDQLSKTSLGCQLDGECCNQV